MYENSIQYPTQWAYYEFDNLLGYDYVGWGRWGVQNVGVCIRARTVNTVLSKQIAGNSRQPFVNSSKQLSLTINNRLYFSLKRAESRNLELRSSPTMTVWWD